MDFNVTGHKKLSSMILDSTLKLIFKSLLFVEF